MALGRRRIAAFFAHPRSPEAGIASYRLAIHRALVEASMETPLAWYKAGMYGLKIALLQRDAGKDDTEILKEAAKYLANSFKSSELKQPDLECQLLYLLSALFLRLDEQAQCQSYMGVLERWKGEVAKGAFENKDMTLGTWSGGSTRPRNCGPTASSRISGSTSDSG